MSDKVVDSFNIFIDTDQGNNLIPSSNGVDYELNLGNSKIDIRKGQHFKISLLNFNMYKTFTNVNRYNSEFKLKIGVYSKVLKLTHTNHKTIRAIVDDFALKLKNDLLSYAQANGSLADDAIVVVEIPTETATLDGGSDNIIKFKIKFTVGPNKVVTNHGIDGLKIQFFTQTDAEGNNCDTYRLLGGKRIPGRSDSEENSYHIDETVPTEITFQGYFHAQKSTEPFIYLHHSLGASTKTLETSSLNEANLSRGKIGEVHTSSILAKVAIDTEFIHFDSLTGGNEYFMNLYNMKHLNNIKFTVKNSHGAPIQSVARYSDAATLGNLTFSMVLKVDIVERTPQDEVHLGVLNRGIDPKKSNLSYNTTF